MILIKVKMRHLCLGDCPLDVAVGPEHQIKESTEGTRALLSPLPQDNHMKLPYGWVLMEATFTTFLLINLGQIIKIVSCNSIATDPSKVEAVGAIAPQWCLGPGGAQSFWGFKEKPYSLAMAHPKLSNICYVHASREGQGGVLYQDQGGGLASRCRPAERDYKCHNIFILKWAVPNDNSLTRPNQN